VWMVKTVCYYLLLLFSRKRQYLMTRFVLAAPSLKSSINFMLKDQVQCFSVQVNEQVLSPKPKRIGVSPLCRFREKSTL